MMAVITCMVAVITCVVAVIIYVVAVIATSSSVYFDVLGPNVQSWVDCVNRLSTYNLHIFE